MSTELIYHSNGPVLIGPESILDISDYGVDGREVMTASGLWTYGDEMPGRGNAYAGMFESKIIYRSINNRFKMDSFTQLNRMDGRWSWYSDSKEFDDYTRDSSCVLCWALYGDGLGDDDKAPALVYDPFKDIISWDFLKDGIDVSGLSGNA